MDQGRPPESVLRYVEYLKKTFPDIKRAYMFGSYVKGSAGGESDIDIAVIFDDFEDSFDLQVELMKLRREFDSRIEPHVFRDNEFDKSYPFAEEIMATGVEIR
ncbi:MAG: nucleotidyltransferase domain-containing protein [Desulfosalsimonas sp.]